MNAAHSTDGSKHSDLQPSADLKHRATAAWYNMGKRDLNKALTSQPDPELKARHVAELVVPRQTAVAEPWKEEVEIMVGISASELSPEPPNEERNPLEKVMDELLGEIEKTILEVGDVTVAMKLSMEKNSANRKR